MATTPSRTVKPPENKMGVQPVGRLLAGMAVPMMISMLVQALYNIVDSIFVARLSENALTAVSLAFPLQNLMIAVCAGTTVGMNALLSRSLGAKEQDKADQAANTGIFLAFCSFAVFCLIGVFFSHTFFRMQTDVAEIVDYGTSYGRICLGCSIGLVCQFTFERLLQSTGRTHLSMCTQMLGALLNIALDLLLILYCHAGVAGAALATVISQGVSGLACLVFMVKRFPILHMTAEERRLDGRTCRTLCLMGIPMGLQYSITAIGSIVLQSAVNGLGSRYVASVAAGTKLFQVICCPFDAMGATMATYCGQNVGAIKLDRLGQGLRACSLLGLGYALLSFAAIFFFAPQMALLFLNPGEEALIGYTAQYITTLGAFFFPLALVNILRFSIQGMGFSNLAILAGVMEMFARMGVATLLVPAIGYTGACFASPAAWICADLFLIPASCWSIAHLRRVYGQPGERSGSPAP